MFGYRTAWATVIVAVGALGMNSVFAVPTLPDFSSAVFDGTSAQVDNPYFPLVVGRLYRYEGQETDPDTGEVDSEVILVEVTTHTRTVAGISARVVRDQVWAEGLLMEDTFDWYAQDVTGNVWYLGEEVTDFHYDDDGNLIGTSHPGAWEAGVDGARPGYLMLAHPMVGDSYYQEFLAGEAEDEGKILGLGETHTVPFGTFGDMVRIADTTALEPDVLEHKFYAPGVGQILGHKLDPDTGAILGVEQLISVTTVPEPTTFGLIFIGAMNLMCRCRRHHG